MSGLMQHKKVTKKGTTGASASTRTVTVRKVRAPVVVTAPAPDRISEELRNKLLNAIVASLVVISDPTPQQRATNSREIAKKFKVSPSQVAGVRAALSRGRYGSEKKLIARFKRSGSIFLKNGSL